MQKKLIALAVASAFVAPAAFAESGNVTIYGVMDASYDLTSNGDGYANANGTGIPGRVAGQAKTSGINTSKVSSNSSRLGFKGSEDLGNGLSAVWQVESQINSDGTSTGNTWNSRNTFVGLSGKSWGTVLLGRHDTPYKLATRNLDMFADGIADNRSIMGGGTMLGSGTVLGVPVSTATLGQGAVASFDGRQSNVIAYITPTMNGFTGAIAYVNGAEGANTSGQSKGNAWSAMVNYGNGPWYGALAYERHNFGNASGDLNGGAVFVMNGATALTAANFKDREEHAWKLGAGYNNNTFRVGLVYEKTGDDLGQAPQLAGLGKSDLFGHHAWNLGGGYTFGNNEVKLQYTTASDTSIASSTGAKQWSLGLDHNFSKRTKIYALYTSLKNDDNANYTLGSASTGAVTSRYGANPTAWSFGMRHTF